MTQTPRDQLFALMQQYTDCQRSAAELARYLAAIADDPLARQPQETLRMQLRGEGAIRGMSGLWDRIKALWPQATAGLDAAGLDQLRRLHDAMEQADAEFAVACAERERAEEDMKRRLSS